MNKLSEYRLLEKDLQKKYKTARETEVFIGAEDFKDGKLSAFGFYRIKQQCDYVSEHQQIELKVPNKFVPGFKDTLEYMGVTELRRLKKDIFETRIRALILLIAGALWYLLGYFLENKVQILKEITVIASWVFVWSAFEKWFFDSKDLRGKRLNLLHILSAKIIPVSDEV